MSKKKTDNQQNLKLKQIREARDHLWRQGVLTWKLEPHQKTLQEFFNKNTNKITVWNLTRRGGKSFALLITATEICIKTPGSIVKYVTPEQKMSRTIVRPIMDEIIKDAPIDVAPEFKSNEGLYRFPNGSEIHLAGTDNQNYNKLRGGSSQLCIVDEAGFCSDLGKVVRSILLPTTLTTGGKILLSSTPPETPDHEFVGFIERAQLEDSYIVKTIDDVVEESKTLGKPRLTQEIVNTFEKEYPKGRDDIEFRREMLCEILKDSSSAVIPEFTVDLEKDVVVNWPKPPYFDPYVSMDIGYRDLTVVLFAYYDFKNGVLVIEDELAMKEVTTDILAADIRRKEEQAFLSPISMEVLKPKIRVSDNNNLIMLNDLTKIHGLYFNTTRKDDKRAAINVLRMELQNRRILINPRCKTLIAHLRNAIWAKNKNEFARNASDKSHYDAVDALSYLVRNVDMSKNPYPAHFGIGNMADVFVGPNAHKTRHSDWEILLKPLKKPGGSNNDSSKKSSKLFSPNKFRRR